MLPGSTLGFSPWTGAQRKQSDTLTLVGGLKDQDTQALKSPRSIAVLTCYVSISSRAMECAGILTPPTLLARYRLLENTLTRDNYPESGLNNCYYNYPIAIRMEALCD